MIHGGHTIADTTSALFVWEHSYYPYYYVPWSAIPSPSSTSTSPINGTVSASQSQYPQWEERGTLTSSDDSRDVLGRLWRVHVSPNESTAIDNVLETIGSTPQIGNMLRIPHNTPDHWLEEDTPIFVHPKDPFKRVDTVSSLRRIKVSLHGVTLAESAYAVHLFETGLPTRYYIPLSSIEQSVLRKSERRTQCPYKGEAEYYDVVLKDKDGKEELHEGLVWYYNRPNMECAQVVGLCCFYNEKVDVEIDGVREERPRTQFA